VSLPASIQDPGLREMLQDAFRLLARGVADRRSPCHTPAVSTVDEDGAPRCRIVVLRGFDPAAATLRFHTDIRSPKWRELARRPDVALLFYDPGARLQVRAEAVAALHAGDAVADAAWSMSLEMSRICYGTEPAPGSTISEGGAFSLPDEPDQIAAGRANFGAVLCCVRRLDILHLAHGGHRRAAYRFAGGAVSGSWIAP
jgi:hypothetical protein